MLLTPFRPFQQVINNCEFAKICLFLLNRQVKTHGKSRFGALLRADKY